MFKILKFTFLIYFNKPFYGGHGFQRATGRPMSTSSRLIKTLTMKRSNGIERRIKSYGRNSCNYRGYVRAKGSV